MNNKKQRVVSPEKLAYQEQFIENIARLNEEEFIKTGKQKSYLTRTYG